MTEKARDAVLGAILLCLVATGIFVDLSATPARVSEAPPKQGSAGELFTERALLCPPAPAQGASVHIAAASSSAQTVPVVIEPHGSGGARLTPEKMLWIPSGDGDPRQVVAYGRGVAASAVVETKEPARGVDAALCASGPSTSWYFAEGGSLLGQDERLLIYNPFPDEAVVRVVFYTPDGPKSKARLSDIAVPSGEHRFVKVNDYVLRQSLLGAAVEAVRGRVVAWRSMTVGRDGKPSGLMASLGAPAPSVRWFFPYGAVSDEADTRISVLNPGTETAKLTLALTTDKVAVQPPEAVGISVPGRTVRRFRLGDFLTGPGSNLPPVAITVTSNGPPVVAEEAVLTAGSRGGVAAQLGADGAATAWAAGPPAADPTADSLTILNPSASPARFSIALVAPEGKRIEPGKLQNVKLQPGLRVGIDLSSYTRGKPVYALVTSDTPVVAGRYAYSRRFLDSAISIGAPVSR